MLRTASAEGGFVCSSIIVLDVEDSACWVGFAVLDGSKCLGHYLLLMDCMARLVLNG